MNGPTNAALFELALDAARAGAAVIRDATPRVRSIEWQVKRPADFVSEVDLAAEAAVLGVIRKRMPEAAILAEESGASPAAAGAPGAGVTFVVDPLDGTTNFLHGYPEYAVSVGAVVGGEPVAGVVIDVALNEEFTATKGGGAFSNGQPIRVSAIEEPRRALIGTGFPFTKLEAIDQYANELRAVMRGAAGIRRAGAAALDLAAVAAGRFEAFWETVLSPWDIAAGLVLVREAGGVVTDYSGGHCPVARTSIVAGNPAMQSWLRSVVTSTDHRTLNTHHPE
ncbi:MAG: inositol monophosphatase [Gemmatimonadetes bacterium]|nr:inositol monophosphatase [Gemmatimonadota bacterium]